ncbi:glycerol kinase GlpK [Ramlibacter sp. AW1]|uniref:Glycerol kinase n=1 Tax=Ramlibacter aurantiacus TaxID=2801330 RepID=A0A937D404_9BURK|nr:glycerol kinase GlpK [Ramlibacter aurantiacus]MBL0423259.1 glycerol kinase GlpK [Ramlibacter aurantiacus]
MTYLLALDQGTSSSRSIVFDADGRPLAQAQLELPQSYPQPGWVEHDPIEIWRGQLDTARQALAQAGVAARELAAIGITNQRETALVWDRATGQPVHPAIVWQDRRTEPLCARLREDGLEPLVRERTGLVIDPYFSATKIAWLLEQVPGLRARAERGELAFGTVDSWLLWQLTGGAVHATDVSNASRTMLFDVHRSDWDAELLARLDIPPALLPRVQASSSMFGTARADLLGAPVPITGIAGDQQAALFGQACFAPGMAKNTYGTGCFMLMHTGNRFQASANGLVTTRTAQAAGQAQYALEGSVFVAGAVVQWLRDGLRAISRSADIEALAASVPDAGGVSLVPAFTGLGAPYWKPDARGTLTGMTRGTTLAHIARAALESIGCQSAALLEAMSRDAAAAGAAPLSELRVDGGASVNDLLMQFQADLLGIPVVRPQVAETTALGAAYLAGLATGVWSHEGEIASLWQRERVFEPAWGRDRAAERMAQWERAVRQAVAG